MIRRRLATLRDDARGATIVEFAIVAPVLIMLIMGLGELMHQTYAQSILDGALQKAGRDSAIQGGGDNTAAIDDKVKDMVGSIVKNGDWTSTRRSYANFAAIGPERFTDTNGNGVRDPGECYDDVNANLKWDADPGRENQGGAEDVTVYTMSVTYPRVFPVARLLGASAEQTLTSRTLLKNQPYASQAQITVQSRCT